ncbi:MAG TPA: hypothetical protein PKY10_05565 [Lentisphaeria bacterium]|nr:hypothetical protein [Lentisphaeria bacterium]
MLRFLMYMLPWRRLSLAITVAMVLALAAPYLADRTSAGTSPDAAGPVTQTPPPEPSQPSAETGSAASQNPLDHLQKLEMLKTLEFTNQGFDWRRDWWKYLALALGSLTVLYFGLHITKMVCRLAVSVFCVGVGIIGALVLEPRLAPMLANYLPANAARLFSAHHVGYVIGFLVSFGLTTIILNWLPKPLLNSGHGK